VILQVYIICTDPFTERMTIQYNNIKVCLVVFVWSLVTSNVSAFQFCSVSFNTYEFPETLPSFTDTILLSTWGEKSECLNGICETTLWKIYEHSLCYKNCRMITQVALSKNNMSENSDLSLFYLKLLHLLNIVAWSDNTKEEKSISCYCRSLWNCHSTYW